MEFIIIYFKWKASSIKVLSDYSFNFTQNEFTYKVGGISKSINTIVDFNNPPKESLIFEAAF
jgi:hypothetical protein